jgi:hypothetical protein
MNIDFLETNLEQVDNTVRVDIKIQRQKSTKPVTRVIPLKAVFTFVV